MIEDLVRKELPKIAKVYGKAAKRALSTIGLNGTGNSAFFQQLETGERMISVRSVDSVLAHMARTWPKGVKWPSTVVPMPGAAALKRHKALKAKNKRAA